jgi:hypothetical protein
MMASNKVVFPSLAVLGLVIASCGGPGGRDALAASTPPTGPDRLFLDVHHLDPGEVTVEGVAEVHERDLAVQDGLVADEIHEVQEGILPAHPTGGRLFMDTHEAGTDVAAADVAAAHREDLAVQERHGVRFLEYWVDESTGRIHCLVEAPDAESVTETHREAHGLLPEEVKEVVAGR